MKTKPKAVHPKLSFHIRHGIQAAGFMLAVLILGLSLGCESSSSSNGDDIDLETPLEMMKIQPDDAETSLQVIVYEGTGTNQTYQTLDNTEKNISFSVSGGTAPYWWHLENRKIGTLTARNHRAIYTPVEPGGNFIVATDSRGNSASATILTHRQMERYQ